MLKGYLKCEDVGKLLLNYIHFELSKNEKAQLKTHLRNCPFCRNKYKSLKKRSIFMKKRQAEIEKILRMNFEISSYMDNEASEDINFIVEAMLYCDENYKILLKEYEEISRILKQAKSTLIENYTPTYFLNAKSGIFDNFFNFI